MNVLKRIIHIVSLIAQVPTTQICPTTSLSDDLNLDNIDIMTIILESERWFNIVLTKEEADRIETIKDIDQCFQKYLRKAAA